MKRGDTLATYTGYTIRAPLTEAICGCPVLTSQLVRAVHDKQRGVFRSSMRQVWRDVEGMMIVAIEGLDASGKATQTKILAEALGGAVISFPTYSTPAGQAILENLQQKWAAAGSFGGSAPWEPDNETNALVLQCLMTINRFEVLPAIKALQAAGTPIVFDRYWASAIVYGTMDGLDRSWIELIQAQLPEPDYWVFLDVSPEESIKRRPERRDRYEKDPHAAERRQRYLSLWKEHEEVLAPIGLMNGRIRFAPKAWSVVDGIGTIDEVHRRILAAVGVESSIP